MELFYREEGNRGKNIVIVHGLYGSSDNWLTIGKILGKNHHVYMIDQRNHGRSPNSAIHSYDVMKEDLAEFFQHHKIKSATVIGHSMGGKVSMYFAAEYPELIDKLIVADISPKNYLQVQEESQYFLHQHILQTLKDLQSQNFENRTDVTDFLKLRIDGEGLIMFLLKSIYKNTETGKFECRLNVNVLYDSLDEIISGVNYRWFEDRKPIFNYPVLFLKGENSNYITNDDIILVRDIYPEAQITTIPNAGHWLHAEQPQLFIEALERFL